MKTDKHFLPRDEIGEGFSGISTSIPALRASISRALSAVGEVQHGVIVRP